MSKNIEILEKFFAIKPVNDNTDYLAEMAGCKGRELRTTEYPTRNLTGGCLRPLDALRSLFLLAYNRMTKKRRYLKMQGAGRIKL